MSAPRLFSPAAIAAHTLLFTPAVGGLMSAVNWRRLGDVRRARSSAALGIGATVILLVAVVLWPARWGAVLELAVVAAAATMAVAFHRQMRPTFEAHRAQGGAVAPFWPATLAPLGFAALLYLAVSQLTPGQREFQAGVDALRAHEDASAERDFRAVLAKRGHDPGAEYNLAVALARQGRDAEALELLHRIPPDSDLAAPAHALQRQLEQPPRK